MRTIVRSWTRTPRLARLGCLAWVVGAVQFFVIQLVVQRAWSTPYSWADNNISDLGNVNCHDWGDGDRRRYVCSPLHDVMNVSFVAAGVLLAAGAVLTFALWERRLASLAARTLLVAAGIGWVLVGLAPADVNENRHVLGALLIMGMGNIGLALAGVTRRKSPLGRARVLTLAAGLVAMAATWLHASGNYGVLGMGGSERIAVFAVNIWTLAIGLWLLLGPIDPAVAGTQIETGQRGQADGPGRTTRA